MANGSHKAAFLAAYNIARVYELQKEHKKGLFYSKVARDRATILDRGDWLGAAFNQMGNFLAAESHFAAATDTYRQALSLLPPTALEPRLHVQVNLAYCALMEGHLELGLRQVYESLRAARRGGWRRLEVIARLDLCYGLLEAGRLRLAWNHGSRGLALAEEMGDPDQIKKGLYLLGEVAVTAGDPDRGHRCFQSLQQRYYPDQPYLPDLLVSVDVRPMVNLRA
jgi:ATP/maltotriose-dependent transcriptional regulator MalT